MNAMQYKIKNRLNDNVIATQEADSFKAAVELTVASGANLSRADLSEADLRGANLRGANLSRADLSEADLARIRDDLWAVLCSSPREVPSLRTALAQGQVDGSCYEGDCACLVGTLANARHCNYAEIPGLTPDSSRAAEVFFCGIDRGDTPETNQFSAIALEWVDQWLRQMHDAADVLVAVEVPNSLRVGCEEPPAKTAGKQDARD